MGRKGKKSGRVWGKKTKLSDYKKINGKRFERTSDPTGKYIAQAKADSSRKRGYKARVIKRVTKKDTRYISYQRK